MRQKTIFDVQFAEEERSGIFRVFILAEGKDDTSNNCAQMGHCLEGGCMRICEFIDRCGGAASPLAFLGQVEDHAIKTAFVWDGSNGADFGVGVFAG